MISKDLGEISVYIQDSVINIIESFKQKNMKDQEAGGILLGQVVGSNIYILKVTIPNIFDKSSRCSFVCDKNAAQLIIHYEFLNSDKKTIYIGEWHTHPEDRPFPSGVDRGMIKHQFIKNKLNEPFLILIIQGLTELYVAVCDGNTIERVNYKILGK